MEERPYKCKKCPKAYKGPCELKHHALTHLPREEWKFKCDECTSIFPDQFRLTEHKKSVHPPEDALFNCPECRETFQSAKALRAHALKHVTMAERKFHCEYCNAAFKTPGELRNHTSDVHFPDSLDRKHVCRKCPKRFRTPTQLKRHEETHKIKKKKKKSAKKSFPCKVCGKILTTYNGLRLHLKNHERGEKKHVCEKCQAEFKTAWELKAHLPLHKVGDKDRIECNLCHQVFKNLADLEAHATVRCIRDQQGYPCPHCTMVCQFPRYLKEHLKSHNIEVNSGAGQDSEIAPQRNEMTFQLMPSKLFGNNNSSNEEMEERPALSLSNTVKLFTCKMCKASMATWHQALKHVSKCKAKCAEFLQCNFCPELIPASCYPLHIHTEILLRICGSSIFKCSFCPLMIPTEEILKLHMKLCRSSALRNKAAKIVFRLCGSCSCTASTDLGMMNHVMGAHRIIAVMESQGTTALIGQDERQAERYVFKPGFKCYICNQDFFCLVAAKFHVKICQKKWGLALVDNGYCY